MSVGNESWSESWRFAPDGLYRAVTIPLHNLINRRLPLPIHGGEVSHEP